MSEDVQGQAAEDSESAESSEATIAVHWREEGYYPPPPKFIGQANASDPAILDRFAEANFPECFREYADLLEWDEYWHTTLDTSNPQFWKWFVGGLPLNVFGHWESLRLRVLSDLTPEALQI